MPHQQDGGQYYQLETQDDIEHEVSPSLAPFVPESCGCHTSRKTASGQSCGVAEDGRSKNLNRDITIEFRVAREVHLAHPARPDERQDLVRSKCRTGRERHLFAAPL